MKLLVQQLARVSARLATAAATAPFSSTAAPLAQSSVTAAALVAARRTQFAPLLAMRAFSGSSKTPSKPTGVDESGSGSDGDDSDSDDADDDDDDDDEEMEEFFRKERAAAARRPKLSAREQDAAVDLDDDWDEERWGAMDSEDWQGFDGDLDAVTEEGVPTWLHSVRELSAIHDEKRMRAKLARRAMEEAKKIVVRHRKVDEQGRAYGTGRRKTSTARVWVKKSAEPFGGRIKINKKDMVDYLERDTHREDVLRPFSVVGETGNFDVYCTVKGGGLTGQAGAIRHGISRALQNFDPEFRAALKKDGLLTRDPRMVERKKPGQPKARKKYQWVKR
ncbi:hypothetical protein PybrP1_007550 [[Pythium] brassicae (nom. inval.)]|nr:hypothetical protein PybrP1_007550 [[Pythium] brassicae (nom. inval.)]